MAVVLCKKNQRGYCIRKALAVKDWRERKLTECPYSRTIEASIDCRHFQAIDDDYLSSIISVSNVEKLEEDFLRCNIGVNTDLGNILLNDILLAKYQDGFLGYIVKIDESRGISISTKLEKEIISEVRKYLKKKSL